MLDVPRTSRRYFQFGLRSLLAVLTVAVVVFGYHANWLHKRNALLAIDGVYDLTETYSQPRSRAPALLWLCGQSGVNTLAVMDYLDVDTDYVEDLFPEAEVYRPCFISGAMYFR